METRRALLPLGLFAAALAMAGCDDRPRPWEGQQGPAVALSAPSSPPTSPSGSGSEDAGGSGDGDDGGTGAGGAGGGGVGAPAAPPVRIGGPWVRCYGNFRLSGEPRKDVTRVSMLCGPSNGMRRVSKEALEGDVAEGKLPVTAPLPLVRGACYRVFAVADRGVTDLDVVVRSSRGVAIATDGGEDAWPIVQPDRPFCALDDDQATVEVSARKGAGRFAAEVWMLRTPAARSAPDGSGGDR